MARNVKSNKSTPESRNIRIWAVLLIVSALCFFLFSISCTDEFWKNLFFLLAGATLTSAIFGIMLEFSDFTDYVTYRLREIVVDHSYLKTLSTDKKLNFKRMIDEELFGEAIKTPESLYSFVDAQISKLLKSSYRKDFHDIHIYRSHNDNWWEDDGDTVYFLYKNKYDTEKLAIRYTTISVYPEGILLTENELLSKLDVKIDEEIFALGKDHMSGKFYLKANEKNKIMTNNQDICLVFLQEEDGRKFECSFCIILDDLMFSHKDHVRVRIQSASLQHKSDKSHSLRVHYPTKDVLLSCAFEDGALKLNGTAFGFNNENHMIREQRSFASIDIKEWMLPGHGAIISWQDTE
jgi:hypothetical protein